MVLTHALASLDIQYEPLEVFTLWVVYIDWVVSGLCELVKDPHPAARLSRCAEYGEPELLFAHSLGT